MLLPWVIHPGVLLFCESLTYSVTIQHFIQFKYLYIILVLASRSFLPTETETYPNETLIHHGFIGCAPLQPSLGNLNQNS